MAQRTACSQSALRTCTSCLTPSSTSSAVMHCSSSSSSLHSCNPCCSAVPHAIARAAAGTLARRVPLRHLPRPCRRPSLRPAQRTPPFQPCLPAQQADTVRLTLHHASKHGRGGALTEAAAGLPLFVGSDASHQSRRSVCSQLLQRYPSQGSRLETGSNKRACKFHTLQLCKALG